MIFTLCLDSLAQSKTESQIYDARDERGNMFSGNWFSLQQKDTKMIEIKRAMFSYSLIKLDKNKHFPMPF